MAGKNTAEPGSRMLRTAPGPPPRRRPGRRGCGQLPGGGGPFGGSEQGRFPCREDRLPADGRHLGLEPAQDVVEQRRGPSALEESFGRELVGRLVAIAILGHHGVDRHDRVTAAALERPLVVMAVGQVVRAGGHQERAKPLVRSTVARLSVSRSAVKKPWTRSSAAAGSCPRRRTKAYSGYQYASHNSASASRDPGADRSPDATTRLQ